MYRVIYLFLGLLTTVISTAQTNDSATVAEPKHKKHANITIEAFDGTSFKGRLVRIANDFIVFDASRYNAPADLRPYYLRPENDNYRIDLEYIKTVTISRGRSIGSQTLYGAGYGGVISFLTAYSFVTRNPVFDSFGEWTTGTVFFVSVGITGGFIYGLFHRRRIIINGSPRGMKKLKDYYFQN